MAKTDRAESAWRARWVGRKHGGRRRAYEAAVAAWRLRDDELRRLRAWASTFPRFAGTTADLLVDLVGDEVVVSVQPKADLVDAGLRRASTLPAPELTVDPVPVRAFASTLPAGIRVMDAGMAIVTDRRLVFLGRRSTCEWWYEQLTGLAHHPAAPFTLMHTRDQQAMSGLLVPPASASLFRTDLTLAYADAVGQRAAVLARLDALIAAHRVVRPPVPAAVRVAQPPRGVAVSAGELVAAGAVAIALLAIASTAFRADPTPTSLPPPVATGASATTIGPPAIGSTVAPTLTPPTAATPTRKPPTAATPTVGEPGGAGTAPPVVSQPAPPPVPRPPTGSTRRPAPKPQPATAQPAPAEPTSAVRRPAPTDTTTAAAPSSTPARVPQLRLGRQLLGQTRVPDPMREWAGGRGGRAERDLQRPRREGMPGLRVVDRTRTAESPPWCGPHRAVARAQAYGGSLHRSSTMYPWTPAKPRSTW